MSTKGLRKDLINGCFGKNVFIFGVDFGAHLCIFITGEKIS